MSGSLRRTVSQVASLAAALLAVLALDAQQPAPKLAVVIVVDQLRADYLVRFREHFGQDGFERFLTRGAWLTQARYEHAATVTCAGHATVLTGSSPIVTGIVGNEWWNREVLREEYCARDDSAPLVGVDGEAVRSARGCMTASACHDRQGKVRRWPGSSRPSPSSKRSSTG